MSAGLPRCFHCGASIPPGMAVGAAGAEAAPTFCCHGCHGAFLLITGAGLDDFYRRREWKEEGLPSRAFQESYRDSLLSRFVYPAKDGSAIDIIIDGIRCASCVWLNERMIGRLDGVREVRVNYATGRARVVFDPAAVRPGAIFSRIAGLGYAPRPYSRSAADESARRGQKDLLFRFGTAVFLSMQLMAYSFALYAGYLQGIEPGIRNYLQLFSLLVTTPIVFYCGGPFLAGAIRSLRNLTPNMELLIATGTLSSFGYSVYATFSGREVYYETAAMIVTLILAGRLLEDSAKRRASAGIEHLSRLCACEARRFAGESLETVDSSELKAGDVVLVSPGERFPADGTIMEGATDVDESAATGEALPVVKSAGEMVLAGTANLTGAVRVRCDRESAESFLARVARLVEEAQTRRAPIQGIADRVSASFVPAVVILSIVTFGLRFLAGEAIGDAVMNALAVLVVACPCALGLATPTAIAAGTGTAAMRGIIFRGGDVLERLAQVKVAVFDKTGTITCGRPAVIEARAAEGTEVREMLSLAASVEMGSLHPVGGAIREEAASAGIIAPVGTGLRTVAGGGVTGRVDGEEVAVGSGNFISGLGVAGVPEELAAPPGCGVICVARSGRYCGAIMVKDRVRGDAAPLVSYFHRAGIRTMLLSGDRQQCAAEAAAAAGIGASFGELTPAAKAARIGELRVEGGAVLMVGDGINDAPALSTADVGCAVAGGTDIAIETSDLVLMKPDLERLACAHRIACRTMSVVRQNLAWAFLYNAIGIPLAMTGRLTPIVAAAAMAVSSLCVVANSLRLKEGRGG